jgi:hypothetical protein
MYVLVVKYTVEISQNFVAFSDYMNFNASMYCKKNIQKPKTEYYMYSL